MAEPIHAYRGTVAELDALSRMIDDAYLDEPGEVVPWALLVGLDRLMGADLVTICDLDVRNETLVEQQGLLDGSERFVDLDTDPANAADYFRHAAGFEPCSYPVSTRDLRSITRWSDFYSDRELRAHPAWVDYFHPVRFSVSVCLPTGPGRMRRLIFMRESGFDFTERDVDVLRLLRPHVVDIDVDAQRRRHGVPRLTGREWEVLEQAALGFSNAEIADRLYLSTGTVRKHMEHIFDQLGVHTRAAAVARAIPHRPKPPARAQSTRSAMAR